MFLSVHTTAEGSFQSERKTWLIGLVNITVAIIENVS